MNDALQGGFADPPRDGQATFAALMRALAEPGRAQAIPPLARAPGLSPAMAAAALTLLDARSAVWLDPALAERTALEAWLVFHTRAQRHDDPGEATFALLGGPEARLPLTTYALGDPRYPDRSTTLLIATPTFEAGPRVVLRGPGVDGALETRLGDLGAAFFAEWRAQKRLFPLGVDVFLVSHEACLGLPRSLDIQLVEAV